MKTFTNLAHRAFKKCASLCTINKKRYYLFIITMLLTLGVGTAWGAEATLSSISTKNVVTTKGQSVSTTFGDVTCKVTRNSGNQPGFYTSSGIVRYYSGDVMTLSVPSGNTITKVVFTMNSGNVGTVDVGTVSSNTWTGNAESISFTGTGTVKITKIVVTYEATSGGETPELEPDPTPDPGTGTTGTLVITRASFPSGSLIYNTTDNWSATASTGETVSGQGDLYSTSNQTTMQTKNSSVSTHYHNTIAMPGAISKISVEVASGTDRSYTVYASTTAITSTTGLTSLGSLKGATPIEIDPTKDYKYFWLQCTGGASYLNNITITYNIESSGGGEPETPATDLTDAQFAWSAATAEATMGASNTFPTLTNTLPVSVTYESSNTAAATIAADGTITLVAPGTTTISAKFAGGEVSGTTYAPKTVTYALTVLKAPATPTENMYAKVTDAVTDGEYLIVYEAGNVAFNGALTNLDAVGNTIEVEISSNTIAGNTEIDAATFTIASMEGGHSIQSKSGTYIGRTSNSNGMNTGSNAIANVITFSNGAVKVAGSGSGASASLQYYAQSGSERFRYYTSSQKAVALYKKVDPNAVVEPQFKLAAGEYFGTQSVEITCATTGAEIYYTLNGTDPTSASTKYTGAISIASTTTIKAVAIKGENSSAVVSATYTILVPLATMQEIFDKATAVEGTATPVHITMNNWVVTGVKNNNVYVTDGTKGLIIYTASHGFNVGDILSGTVACKVQLYNGSSELTELTSTTEGLTVTTGGVVTPVVVNDVTTLGGVNTGSVIKITGPCTVDGTKYYVAGVQLFNSLYTYTNPEDGYNYECTGVYLQYNTTKEILPRKAEDLVKIETQQPAGISFAVTEHTAEVGAAEFAEPTLTNPNSLTVTYKTSDETLATVNATTGEVTIGNKEGKVTITASFAGDEDYVAADASYNITITDPDVSSVTFDAIIDKTADAETLSLTKDVITMTFTGGAMNNGENYRCYSGQKMTISYADGNITKIVLECTTNNDAKYGPGCFETETASYSYSGKVGTWTGEAKSIIFNAKDQVRMTTVTVYYKQDNRAEAGLAWNPATVSLTVGDAFTAPTLSNPNDLTLTCTSDNEALATVTNAGVVTLKSGVTGKATITAKFDGNSNYKDATVTCTITVNPKTETVVILAQYNGQWYALKNVEETAGKVLAALPVNYVGGKLYNVEEANKATIEWQRAAVTDGIIFKNGENYIYGTAGSTDLKLSTTECAWTLDGTTYKLGNRTFLYRAQANGFKNYNAEDNAGTDDYSDLPVVTAPVYATGDAYSRSTTAGKFGTICLPFGSTNYTGMELYEFVGKEEGKAYIASVTTLEAGIPYIFRATANELAVYSDGTTAATPGEHYGLVGTFTDDTEVTVGNYILFNNAICEVTETCWVNANRAYIVWNDIPAGAPQQMPGRRYIGMSVQGENAATGLDNITNGENTTIKLIENGQLIIIRGGEKFNAQGHKL